MIDVELRLKTRAAKTVLYLSYTDAPTINVTVLNFSEPNTTEEVMHSSCGDLITSLKLNFKYICHIQ